MVAKKTETERAVHVLLVEDEPDAAVLIQDALEGVGFPYTLQVVETGEAAIALLSGVGNRGDEEKHPSPFVLLLDLKMPGVGGFGVLRWLCSHPDIRHGLKVVILSSAQSPREIEVVFELGANFFWPKSDCLTFQKRIQCLRESWTGLCAAD